MSGSLESDLPSPSEWIDDDNNCTICGTKVNELNEDSHQELVEIGNEDFDEPTSKRHRTQYPDIADYVEIVSTTQSPVMEDAEIARVVYTKQLKLQWPMVSRCTNCFNVSSSRLTEKQLTETLLDDELAKIKEDVDSAVGNAKSLTLMIDGWSHIGLSHAMLHISVHTGLHDGQPIFLYSSRMNKLSLKSSWKNEVHDAKDILKIISKIMKKISHKYTEICSKLHAIVTDNINPSDILSEAWNFIENKFSNISCYGSSAVAIKRLAEDLCHIDSIKITIASNEAIAKFVDEIIDNDELQQQVTDDIYFENLDTFLAHKYKFNFGLKHFIMMRKNLRLQELLRSTVNNLKSPKKVEKFKEVCKLVMDTGMFWESTRRAVFVLNVLACTLNLCKNCILPLSAMPHIWAHITLHLGREALTDWGFSEEISECICAAVASRRAVNVRPVTCAAHALDPYFRGKHLSNEEWEAARNFIVRMSSDDEAVVSAKFTEYKMHACSVHELDKYLTDVQTESYSQNQIDWWNSFAPNSPLVPIAKILLAMPASVADVKRYIRLYNIQMHDAKWDDDVRDKLETVSYNLNIKSCHDAEKENLANRMKNVLSLCTSHTQVTNIGEENKDLVQPDLIDPEDKHNDLLQSPLITPLERDNAYCSENTSPTSSTEARLQDSSQCTYTKYDSIGGVSLWSRYSSLVPDFEDYDSNDTDYESPPCSDEQTGDSFSPRTNPLALSPDGESTESVDSLMYVNDPSTSEMSASKELEFTPSPFEWIDDNNKCMICGTEVNQDVNFESSPKSAVTDDDDDSNQPVSKRQKTQSPITEDEKITRMEDTEVARLVYIKQLKLYWPTYSSCTNCIREGESRLFSEDQLATTLLDDQLKDIQQSNTLSLNKSKCVTLMIDGWNCTYADYDNVVLNTCAHTGIDAGYPIFLCSNLAKNDKTPCIVSKIIGRIVTQTSNEVRSNLRAIVTDNCGPNDLVPIAMNFVENIFSEPIQIYCYGSASAAIKELANHFWNIESIQTILLSNQLIAQFFDTEDVRAKLQERYNDENNLQVRGTIPADNIHVGLEAFITLRRNLELQRRLGFIINDCIALKQFDKYYEVYDSMERDVTFWESTRRIAYVYNVLANVLRFCKNCNLPLSVMPHIWAHITLHLNSKALSSCGFDREIIESICAAVASKRAIYVRPIMCAAHALDPYFKGLHLDHDEWEAAHNVIMSMSSYDATVTSTEFTKYRVVSRFDHSRDEYLTNLQTDSYSQNQIKWWNSLTPKSPLAGVAMLLLSMPASVANVKRYNQPHVLQLHKSIWINQIRDKLAEVSYNMNIMSHYERYKHTAADTMKELLSLCTVHTPLIKIGKEICIQAQSQQAAPGELMLVDSDEDSVLACSEHCPNILALQAQPQDSGKYYEYDSNDDESLWSNDCPFVSDEENTDSSYSVNNPLIETAEITDSYCRQFIPLKVHVENNDSSIGQNIPLGVALDVESTNSISHSNNQLTAGAPFEALWDSVGVHELLPGDENSTLIDQWLHGKP